MNTLEAQYVFLSAGPVTVEVWVFFVVCFFVHGKSSKLVNCIFYLYCTSSLINPSDCSPVVQIILHSMVSCSPMLQTLIPLTSLSLLCKPILYLPKHRAKIKRNLYVSNVNNFSRDYSHLLLQMKQFKMLV